MIPQVASLYDEMVEEGANPDVDYCAIEKLGAGTTDEYGRYRILKQGMLMECIEAVVNEAESREECDLSIVESTAFVSAMKTEGTMQ